MERWKKWLSFNFKKSFLRPSKAILLKVISRLRHKSKEKGTGMVSLYKDKEACAGYEDIQVMWEMVHSSIYTNSPQTRKMRFRRRVCFRPT
ncbi:hypothetical protein DCAR_0830413 [Daucus carota subsp. sativus]|uniref:Uncharacterized protein n=1 Tax=Daucus carota subsp. sativus TaxID=79200 RepID=A0A175YKD2_DAUCS|nr:hypothetical protein DCAR_0830413 [Daucus carota subsp. sativus]